MKRILITLVLMLLIVMVADADWITFPFGRIRVQEYVSLNGNMMQVLNAAGSAQQDAQERITKIVEEHCQEQPEKCAAMGITIIPPPVMP